MENVATSDYYGTSFKANIYEPQSIDPRVAWAINLITFESNDTLSPPSFFSQTCPQPLAFNNEAFQPLSFNCPPPPALKYVPCLYPPLQPEEYRSRLMWYLAPAQKVVDDFRIEQVII